MFEFSTVNSFSFHCHQEKEILFLVRSALIQIVLENVLGGRILTLLDSTKSSRTTEYDFQWPHIIVESTPTWTPKTIRSVRLTSNTWPPDPDSRWIGYLKSMIMHQLRLSPISSDRFFFLTRTAFNYWLVSSETIPFNVLRKFCSLEPKAPDWNELEGLSPRTIVQWMEPVGWQSRRIASPCGTSECMSEAARKQRKWNKSTRNAVTQIFFSDALRVRSFAQTWLVSAKPRGFSGWTPPHTVALMIQERSARRKVVGPVCNQAEKILTNECDGTDHGRSAFCCLFEKPNPLGSAWPLIGKWPADVVLLQFSANRPAKATRLSHESVTWC